MTIDPFRPWRDPVVLEVRPRDKPDGRPLGIVLVTFSQETELTPSLGMGSASFELRMELISQWQGVTTICNWGGSYKALTDIADGEVRLTHWDVQIKRTDMRGIGLGTYAMDQIVHWVQKWPKADVRQIRLSASDATKENKERRNHFYERFGLVFDYSEDGASGVSRPMKVEALKRVAPPDNITVRPMSAYLYELFSRDVTQQGELASFKRSFEALLARHREAEKKPLAWLMRTLWWKH